MIAKTLKPTITAGLLLVAGIFSMAGSAGGTELFYRGDADLNGDVDLSDAVYLFNYLFLGGSAPGCEDGADATDDGLSLIHI